MLVLNQEDNLLSICYFVDKFSFPPMDINNLLTIEISGINSYTYHSRKQNSKEVS